MTCGICTQEGLDAGIARWRECKKGLLASRQNLHLGHSAEIACRRRDRGKKVIELRVVEWELVEQEVSDRVCFTNIESVRVA
jgi:hypothetical protein